MKLRLKVIDKVGADFNKIKAEGFSGVVFGEKSKDLSDITAAKRKRLKVFFHSGDFSKIPCRYLGDDGSFESELYAVTEKTLKAAKKKLGTIWDLIDFIIVPVPHTKGLLYKYEIYDDFNAREIAEDCSLIFDESLEADDVRTKYYTGAAETLFYDYSVPVFDYAKGLGKRLCFNLGSAARSVDLIKKSVNPFMFTRGKIPIIYEADGEFTFTSGSETGKDVLLILPMRSVMSGYAWGMRMTRLETPLNTALGEEEYYKTMLGKCGFDYKVVDEAEFSKIGMSELKRFRQIILCDSCIISDRDRKRLEALDECRINDKAFLDILDREN